MKRYITRFILLVFPLLILSCRGEGASKNQSGQSTDAAAGKHIGASADSTTVDGESGSMSNN